MSPTTTSRWPGRLSIALVAIILLAVAIPLVFAPQAHAALSYNSQEIAFVKLLNDYRVANGQQPVLVSDRLTLASRRHASDMAKYTFFSHTTRASDWFPIDSQPWDRMRFCGYYSPKEGENLAAGQATAQLLFNAWKSSSAHNGVMLDPGFKVVGIEFLTVVGSVYPYYWVADFGGTVDAGAHTLGPMRYQQTSGYIRKGGAWYTTSTALASGGSYGSSSTTGSYATIAFTGTRLDWITTVAPLGGRVDVYLDGIRKTTVESAYASTAYRVRAWSTGTIPYGRHTVKLVRNAYCTTGEFLSLDAVDIWGTLRPAF